MAKNKSQETPLQEATTQFDENLKKIFEPEVLKKYGSKAGVAILILALAFSFIRYFSSKNVSDTQNANKALGPAYVHFTNQNPDSAELYLVRYVSTVKSDIARSKGYLLMGKALYLQKKYQEALEAYQNVKGSDVKHALIVSGALHGIAACHMELKNYQQAAQTLEDFVNRFMRKKAPSQSTGQQDLSPAVPNALWKLALCYRQLGQIENLKSTLNRLIAAYGDSSEAKKAKNLLVSI